jgi:hypothetical protein
MPLDPSILAQGKPFQTPDPLQNYAKVLQIQNAQNQNALTQYQLGTAKRGEEGQNALSRAQQAAYDPATGTYDMNKLRGSMISGGFGALLPDVEKKMSELRSQQLTQQKTEGEVVAGRTKQFREYLVCRLTKLLQKSLLIQLSLMNGEAKTRWAWKSSSNKTSLLLLKLVQAK